jgi:hypothetical protein
MVLPHRLAFVFLCLAACFGLLVATGACSTDAAVSGTAGAKLPNGTNALEHEECDESGNRVEVLDLNGDGKADIRRVFSKGTSRELCRIVDLNHDGKADLYEYFDANGAVRRREFCYDDTGVVNAIEHYDAGRLTKREYDTSGQHTIDTWDYFDPGLPVDPKTGRPAHPSRRERDRTGDGRVDEWWTWEANRVTIARDSNGDGKPDPASSLVLGGEADAGSAVASNTPVGAASGSGGRSPAPAAADAGSSDGGKP